MPPKLDVLFLGTHGQYNIGDELLLETFVARLGCEHRYRINSYDPEMTASQLEDYSVQVFDTATDRVALLGHLRRCDVVVFGGGSIIKELGSTTGRWRYSTMMMLLAVVVAARVLRKPMLMSNIGVGPIATAWGERLARLILAQVTLVSVRDRASLDLCSALGCDMARIRLVPDAVWSNERADFGAVGSTTASCLSLPLSGRQSLESFPQSTGRVDCPAPLTIGLNLNRDIQVPDRWDAFVEELRAAIEIVAASRPIRLVGLPMQTGFKENDDRQMLEAFFASVPDLVTELPSASDHHEIAEWAAGCDVVVAERLHALVTAAILGRPVVALSYDPKVTELADQLSLGPRCFDVNQPIDAGELGAQILAAADDLDEPQRLSSLADQHRTEALDYFADVQRWLGARGKLRRWPEPAAT